MSEVSVDELRQRVIQSCKAGDWKKCLEACRELNSRFPDNLSITLKLGEIYLKVGAKDSAIETYRKAAESHAGAGDFLKAVGVYKMILNIAPNLKDIKDRMDELCSAEKPGADAGTLPEIPLLSELEEAELVELVNGLTTLHYDMGEVICRDGDDGDSILIIAKGAVKIYVEGVAGEKIGISQLKDGDFFGEVGFFTDGKRHASVMAMDDTDLLEMKKDAVLALEKKHPNVGGTLESFYKKRVLDKILAVSPLFSTLKESDRQELLGSFNLKTFESGDVVISEGDEGDSLFIIKSGKVEVTTGGESGGKVSLAQLKEGDFFGEVSLITGKKRTATISAVTPLELMELSKGDLMACSEKYPKVKEVLDRYRKVRVEQTVSKIMALKEMETKEGLV